MAGPYTILKRRIEDAVEALVNRYLSVELSGVTIFKGTSRSKLTTPRLSIVCKTATPAFADEGTLIEWMGEVVISVVSNQNDSTRDQHEDWDGHVQDLILTENIADSINNLDDVYGLKIYDGLYGWEPGPSGDDFTDAEQVSGTIVTVRCVMEEM